MKKNRKHFKFLVVVGALCLTAAISLGLVNQNNVTASANEITIESVDGNFYMEHGARVRIVPGSSGIRFCTRVSEEWYNLATADGQTVEFYTSVDKYNNEDEGEEVVLKADELSKDDDGYYFSGSIVYDALEEQYENAAFNMQLEATAYAIIKKDGSEIKKVVAASDDNVRSMAEVADKAIRRDSEKYNNEQIAILNNYRKIETVEQFVDSTFDTFDITTVYEGATLLKVDMIDSGDSYVDSKFSFVANNENTPRESLAVLFTDKGIIEANFKVCAKVIRTVDDWSSVFNQSGIIKGYYYLENNITGYKSLNLSTAANSANAFSGVLDGGGHSASFSLASKTGVFRYLTGATVKNLNLNVKGNSGWQYSAVAQYVAGICSFSDLYIKTESVNDTCTRFSGFSEMFNGQSDFNRVVIETPQLQGDNFSSFSYYIQTINETSGETNNDQYLRFKASDMYVISNLPLSVNKWKVYAVNQMTDTNDDGAITVADIDTTNKITYWPTPKDKSFTYSLYGYASLTELKTASEAGKTNLTKYTEISYWGLDVNGLLTWNGANY